MNVFKGNLPSGQVLGPWLSRECLIKYFIISNKSSSLVVVNVFVKNGNTEILLCPKDMEIKAGESLLSEDDIVLLANENILIKSTGNIDYYFSIL